MNYFQQLQIVRRRYARMRDRWLLPPPRNPLLIEQVAANVYDSPLLLISQIQRSGGTLLSQLLDGHPSLMVFPGELHLAKPKYKWPYLLLWLPPEFIFRKLVDHRAIEYAREGYKKSKLATERIPFDYDVGLHCAAFSAAFRRLKPKNQREVFNIYFSTFFGSWLNCKKHTGNPRFFCAFAADFAVNSNSVRRFFNDYPDGRMLSIVRDPATWLASAMAKQTTSRIFSSKEKAIRHWRRSCHALQFNKALRPNEVDIVAFSELIENTESTIRALCKSLDLPFDAALIVPTFNGEPIESNSSFEASKGVINKKVLARKSLDECDPDDRALFARLRSLRTGPHERG